MTEGELDMNFLVFFFKFFWSGFFLALLTLG